MILNMFKSQWCPNFFIDFANSLPQEFSFFISNRNTKYVRNVTFTERGVKAVGIQFMDSPTPYTMNVDASSDFNHIKNSFERYMTQHTKTPTKGKSAKTLKDNKSKLQSELLGVLGIDNDISVNGDIEFCINNYSTEERNRIMSLLERIDPKSAEVYIKVALGFANQSQLNSLANQLIEVEVTESISQNSLER